MSDKITPYESYLPIKLGIDETVGLIEANLEGETVTPFDLSRAKNPSGGSIFWEIPGVEEKPEVTSEIEGIIIFHRTVRVFYATEFADTGGGTPPDCVADDGRTGIGTPGGLCAACPKSQWGSGKNEGQACSQIKQLFILRRGELLPTLVNLTPINYGAAKKYLLTLLSKRQLPFNAVVTKLSGEKGTSKGGHDIQKVVLSMIEALPEKELAVIQALTETWKPILSGMTATETIDNVPITQIEGDEIQEPPL